MDVRLEPWAAGDLDLLRRLNGDPAMMEHLGGPESEAQLVHRQARYELPGSGMYKVLGVADGRPVGSVGFWEREWLGDTVYETGWSVLPEFQGRGIATRATALAMDPARAQGARRWVHAFPGVDNAASNAVCRRLGFELLQAHDFEYPKGHWMRCNDWRLDLQAGRS